VTPRVALRPRTQAAHPSFVAKQVYPLVEMPSMSVELMTDAVKKAIRTAVAADKDHLEPTFNY
jgi:pyroglutamyl-peptidase